jgi:glutamate/tyrosine decarboxylase-like PLP-dependent enzyme
VAGGNHAAVYVERAVLAWIKALLGYPPTSMGLLVSGGSMANLTGLAVARHVKAGFDVRKVGMQAAGEHGRLVMYTSTESHSCIQKAAELLGIGSDNLRKVAVDDEFRMDVADLVRQIEADRAAGLRPLCVAASLGTVNTGAIDPLADIAEICRRFDLWFHIDGAYGGFAALVPEIRCQVAALAEADSLAVDPHKWLFIPVEAGCALVKDAAAMRDAFSLVPPYLRTEPTGFGGLPWFSEYGVQQSRGFRALKLWMSLKQIGAERYRQMIASNVELAHYLHRRVSETPELEVMAPAPLSIVCFRYVPPGWSGRYAGADLDARLDELNRRLVPAIQVDGRVFVTNAVLRGRFVLRACIVNYRTQREDLDLLVETVLELGQQIAQGHT